jgi:hypothetical protein
MNEQAIKKSFVFFFFFCLNDTEYALIDACGRYIELAL